MSHAMPIPIGITGERVTRTLLTGAVVVTCDESHTVHTPGDVLIEDDHIGWVGPSYTGEYDVRISCAGRLIMPGLVNAHTHSPMTLFRSLADDVDLRVFLEERAWPREVRLTGEEAYAGSVLAGIEMLTCGVTTYADMYFFEEDLVRAALDVGLRALITPAIVEAPIWVPRIGHWDRLLEDGLSFCRRWEGHAGRIHTGLGPHAPYSVPFEALVEIAAEARRAGVAVQTHLLEARWERDSFNAAGRGGTVAALEGAGFFDGPVIAAHSVWLEAGDIEIYHRKNVGVAHCPQSNAKLGCGIAPVAAMLAAGVCVGLGTDGAATNNNLDLWEELRLAPLLAKVSALDPRPVNAREALWMATRMGAGAIHRPDIGVLDAGYRADIVMLNAETSMAVPIFEPGTYVDHLVYAMGAHLVDSVWVNGTRTVKAGEVLTVDEERARHAAQEAALAVSQRMFA